MLVSVIIFPAATAVSYICKKPTVSRFAFEQVIENVEGFLDPVGREVKLANTPIN